MGGAGNARPVRRAPAATLKLALAAGLTIAGAGNAGCLASLRLVFSRRAAGAGGRF